MLFYIVTPSYNQLSFLRRCVASVADQIEAASQQSIIIHHHIQDACSTDGTVEFLKEYAAQVADAMSPSRDQPATKEKGSNAPIPPSTAYSFSFASEADNGMYDAINRGWKLAMNDADVIAHLNCDEQYLPGALQTIADFFRCHQEADVVLADMIVVDNDGAYICHRRSLKPNALLSQICCVGMTTTTFQRASVVRDKQVLFDTSWRNIGDMVWYNALHRAGVHFVVCNELVSVFTDTGVNLNLTEEAVRERKRYADEFLHGSYFFTLLISKFYSLRRFLKEFYLKSPTEYAFFWNNLPKREIRSIERPTGLWHRRGPSLRCSAGEK